MNMTVIDHKIDKEKEGTYYRLPFTVPEGVESLTVHYSYPKTQKAVVDLGLMDEKERFLGWSGSAREEVTVAPVNATPGYWQTEVRPGTWYILVGAYHIPKPSLMVTYEIEFGSQSPRWLAGDLHVHSTASDGKLSPNELGQMAKKKGLDFLAIADHNNYCENFNLPKIPGLTFIPAVEWTHYKGHINFYGVNAPFENSFIANDLSEMQELIQQVKDRGALISVNHPKCPLCPYLWGDNNCFDMIEVWNGPMRKANTDAIQWWHQFLMDGRKIPIVGGSDFHRKRHVVRMANPTTYVYSPSVSAEAIREAISKGHSYVTASVKGPRLFVQMDGIQFGDTVVKDPNRTWRFKAENLHRGWKVQLITDKGIVAESQGEIQIVESNWRFAYLKVVASFGKLNFVRAISNPIYFE